MTVTTVVGSVSGTPPARLLRGRQPQATEAGKPASQPTAGARGWPGRGASRAPRRRFVPGRAVRVLELAAVTAVLIAAGSPVAAVAGNTQPQLSQATWQHAIKQVKARVKAASLRPTRWSSGGKPNARPPRLTPSARLIPLRRRNLPRPTRSTWEAISTSRLRSPATRCPPRRDHSTTSRLTPPRAGNNSVQGRNSRIPTPSSSTPTPSQPRTVRCHRQVAVARGGNSSSTRPPTTRSSSSGGCRTMTRPAQPDGLPGGRRAFLTLTTPGCLSPPRQSRIFPLSR